MPLIERISSNHSKEQEIQETLREDSIRLHSEIRDYELHKNDKRKNKHKHKLDDSKVWEMKEQINSNGQILPDLRGKIYNL